MKEITIPKLVVLVSIFLVVFGNVAFFSNVSKIYPPSMENIAFLFSLALLYCCVNVIFLSLICFKHTTKPFLISVLLASSVTAYFMDTYNVIIDENMLDNALKTNIAESFDLISLKLFLYIAVLGIAPSFLIYKTRIANKKIQQIIISKISTLGIAIVITISSIVVFGNFYASFIREHKQLRFYANPAYYIYSIGKYIGKRDIEGTNAQLQTIGEDAKTPDLDSHRELIILVVGETARADRFSLNGYTRKTNPLLEQETLLSFKNTWACGTSTSVSVPCMFSIYDHAHYLNGEANAIENMLDVLQHAGVNVIWLDNNSDSKGVAERVTYENYRTRDKNPICDTECRDEGMLSNLQTYIDQHPKGDIFIILHQMGNHGPAYYKRYPKEFEKFTPTCQTNQLENCSREEIDNAYDNAILYTDYFLAKTIALLKRNDDKFESALFYVSDHGESLGENNLYLHGLPYMFAPDTQTHVPMIMWFGNGFDKNEIDLPSLSKKTDNRYTHDNVFHTILGLFELETAVYDKKLDIIDHQGHD